MPALLKYLIMLMFFSSCYALDDNSSVAFCYAENPPLEELRAFDVAVVAPQKRINPKLYKSESGQLYAYVNVGEVDSKSDEMKKIKSSWRKGRNPVWSTVVMDMSNPDWRSYLLNEKITPLWESGYQGFFLDTLDSYQLLKLTPAQKRAQQAGIIDFIKQIKAKYPDAKIIANRGFEILDSVHNELDAIAAESLFSSWNPKTKRYESVSEKDRVWLLNMLNKAHQTYKLPVIVIDYVPPNDKEKRKQIAKKIRDLGFIPWVGDANLETLGQGKMEIIPRKIFLIYDETPSTIKTPSTAIAAFKFGAFPLQYMGFVPVVHAVNSSLPENLSPNEYAGIIAWFDKPEIKNQAILEKWLTRQVQAKIPVVFIQNFGLALNSPLLKSLNIKIDQNPKVIKEVNITEKDDSVGYEILPKPVSTDFFAVTNEKSKVWLRLTSGKFQEEAIAITPWGGYALDPFNVIVLPGDQARWVINPFKFFREALRLPLFPIPDVTTANGKRILTVHIDGDAFISRVTWMDNKYTSDLILNDILKHYKIPTTVSVIQREFELIEKNDYLIKRLSNVAKEIFALPWVEIATHTYSHPLEWGSLVEGQPNTKFLSYPAKDYLFSYQKEIAGSTEFINRKLAPPNKKVVAVFWSGDTNLREKPLEVAAQTGIKNINGFSALYLRSDKSITNLNAFGIKLGNYFQVFSPIPNEFEYTDNWSPPYYSFQNVIHTYELTENPVRYKPMSLYYHFYAAADQAAFRSLKRIYNWILDQNYIPLYIADYIDRVNDFNNLTIAKDLSKKENSWYILNNNSLREFRMPIKSPQYVPDLNNSRNVIGFNTHNQDLYIHLGAEKESRITLSQSAPTQPYLAEANAEVSHWSFDGGKISFSLEGNVPLSFKLANMGNCQLEQNQKPVKVPDNNNNITQETSSGRFEIHCQGTT